MSKPETSQTLDRGLRLLNLLAESPDGMTVTELAHALQVSRTVVYRLVVTLESSALLRRGSDGRCRIGLAVLALARQVQPLLRDAAMPPLRALADGLGCTAHLTVVDGNDALVVAVVDPPRADLYVGVRVGNRAPLESTSAGRAVLVARQNDWLPGEPGFTTWTSATGGTSGVAAPVLGVPGLEAAVGVLVLDGEDLTTPGIACVQAAAEVTRGLH